ncbi:archaellin/type IV pilin N-terminal domain-containing protein [Natronoglomus mannanivorans]|uniref:Flagellin n=1 Tax=Natronoglomus mannanivorans TaxID=2979990 RepID=A0AAP3E3J9_9EURY|nr:flagellin [Halobacteria archaeon AArc-xg1-1]
MFEMLTDEHDRGQVGIGTLIVFIAMVLVAAIAAGVLINTAGSLQSQASDTGTETQQAVANQVEVVHAYGITNYEDGGPDATQVEELRLVVKKSAGSDVIDIDSMTVQYTSSTASETLTYDENSNPGDDNPSGFTTTELASSTSDTALVNTDDRIEIGILLDSTEAPVSELDVLEPGDSATVEIVDQSGAQFSYGVTVPATFSDTAAVVEV